MPDQTPDVMILCGGRGTRLQERTQTLPKPLVEIGGRPIVWHVVRIYAAQGFRRFVLLTGHKSEAVEQFASDADWPEGVAVECVFTGEDTPTGGRVHRARSSVGDGTFALTYADGVADIDLAAELDHHRAHGDAATMAVVRPELQFGVTEIGEDDRVSGFHEKPRSDHWINGGFFFLEPQVFDYLDDSSVLEREPLEALATDGKLHVWRHTGFWECMDTYKDAVTLNDLWTEQPPWKVWD
jgi:glucose-1-phosphate cytidylyltransferase